MTETKSTAIDDDHTSHRLTELLSAARLHPLQIEQNKHLSDYVALIRRWNARTNLTAIRDEEGILSRHIVESIACAQAIPVGIATLLDFGSGPGFPGIPIAICRPEIAVTLAESQGKKAAFLQEAVRVTGVSAKVHPGRAETLSLHFDCVTLRAVDRMERAVQAAVRLVRPNGWLAVMTTTTDLPQIRSAAGHLYIWSAPVPLCGADNRILALARRSA